MPAVVKKIRRFLERPSVRYWLPNRKVLAGTLASLLVLAGRKAGVLDLLPAGWSETVSFAIVAYLVKEFDYPDAEVEFEPDEDFDFSKPPKTAPGPPHQ